MKKIFLFIFLFLNVSIALAADNVDYTAKVDCSNWNDTTAQIQQGTTSTLPYLSLKKATEDIFKLNNQHTNSRFWIKIKDGCSFVTDPVNRTILNINSWGGATKNNSFFMETETNSGLFYVNVLDAWFLEITTGWSLFQIKNGVFKSWKNWIFLSNDSNWQGWLTIKDSKFDIENQLMWNPSWDPTGGNFEVSNSLIELNKKYGRSIFRFPSYFHDNVFNYRSLTNSSGTKITTDWLFWITNLTFHPNNISSNEYLGVVKNEINVYLNTTKNNFNDVANRKAGFFVWVQWIEKVLLMSNKFNFLNSSSSYFSVFKYCSVDSWCWWSSYLNGDMMIVNNYFSNLTEVERPINSFSAWWMGWVPNPRYKNDFFINNTFGSDFNMLNYNSSSVVSNGPRLYQWYYAIFWFNNLNGFTTQTPNWNNFAGSTTQKGFRIAVDLNRDSLISDKEKISDFYCEPQISCKDSSSPTLIIY